MNSSLNNFFLFLLPGDVGCWKACGLTNGQDVGSYFSSSCLRNENSQIKKILRCNPVGVSCHNLAAGFGLGLLVVV